MMLSPDEAKAMQALVLLALALFLISRTLPISETWRRRGLILASGCLAAALAFTVVAWYA